MLLGCLTADWTCESSQTVKEMLVKFIFNSIVCLFFLLQQSSARLVSSPVQAVAVYLKLGAVTVIMTVVTCQMRPLPVVSHWIPVYFLEIVIYLFCWGSISPSWFSHWALLTHRSCSCLLDFPPREELHISIQYMVTKQIQPASESLLVGAEREMATKLRFRGF